jgi:hypothetical protein
LANQGTQLQNEKAEKSEIKIDLPSVIQYLVYKFQMICYGELNLLGRNQMRDI